MGSLTCFLCEKDVINVQDSSSESQKDAFEEHLSDVHGVMFDVDYLFSATNLKMDERHKILKEEFGVTPAHLIEQLSASKTEPEIKDDIKPYSGPQDTECKTKMGKTITDFTKGRQCQFCERWFTRPWCLKQHLNKCSVKNKPYDENRVRIECRVCNKTFLLTSYLRTHEESHRDISDKPYSCIYIGCEKVFMDRNAVRGCERVHEELFKCSVCAMCFRGGKDLELHEVSHNELRFIYNCDECDTGSFVHDKSIKKHILTLHNCHSLTTTLTLFNYS